jgi:DNA-binding transcriptional regulator GbsR (MarR family)
MVDPQAAPPPEKPDIVRFIMAVLAQYPHGLTTREVVELTGLTSYNASAKLSKLAASGVIQKITIAGDRRQRWRVRAQR